MISNELICVPDLVEIVAAEYPEDKFHLDLD